MTEGRGLYVGVDNALNEPCEHWILTPKGQIDQHKLDHHPLGHVVLVYSILIL
jgi:hypothetical protein